jgi:hypothetical protein
VIEVFVEADGNIANLRGNRLVRSDRNALIWPPNISDAPWPDLTDAVHSARARTSNLNRLRGVSPSHDSAE